MLGKELVVFCKHGAKAYCHHRSPAGCGAGRWWRLVVEKTVAAAAVAAIELAGEVKGHSCTECCRVFSTGKALGGHMSSAHGPLKKFDSFPKKLKFNKNQESFQTGKFSWKCCVEFFIGKSNAWSNEIGPGGR